MFREEWTTKAELSRQIRDGLQRITDCKLLIVCIMSHGTAGALRCEDDNRSVTFNDVMFEFTRKLRPELPMVRSSKLVKRYSIKHISGSLLVFFLYKF